MLLSLSLGYCPTDEKLDVGDIFYPEKRKIYLRTWLQQLNREFPGEHFRFDIDPFVEEEPEERTVHLVFDPDVTESQAGYDYVKSAIPEDWDDIACRAIENKVGKLNQDVRNNPSEFID